jgi:hypothetical protein
MTDPTTPGEHSGRAEWLCRAKSRVRNVSQNLTRWLTRATTTATTAWRQRLSAAPDRGRGAPMLRLAVDFVDDHGRATRPHEAVEAIDEPGAVEPVEAVCRFLADFSGDLLDRPRSMALEIDQQAENRAVDASLSLSRVAGRLLLHGKVRPFRATAPGSFNCAGANFSMTDPSYTRPTENASNPGNPGAETLVGERLQRGLEALLFESRLAPLALEFLVS